MLCLSLFLQLFNLFLQFCRCSSVFLGACSRCFFAVFNRFEMFLLSCDFLLNFTQFVCRICCEIKSLSNLLDKLRLSSKPCRGLLYLCIFYQHSVFSSTLSKQKKESTCARSGADTFIIFSHTVCIPLQFSL